MDRSFLTQFDPFCRTVICLKNGSRLSFLALLADLCFLLCSYFEVTRGPRSECVRSTWRVSDSGFGIFRALGTPVWSLDWLNHNSHGLFTNTGVENGLNLKNTCVRVMSLGTRGSGVSDAWTVQCTCPHSLVSFALHLKNPADMRFICISFPISRECCSSLPSHAITVTSDRTGDATCFFAAQNFCETSLPFRREQPVLSEGLDKPLALSYKSFLHYPMDSMDQSMVHQRALFLGLGGISCEAGIHLDTPRYTQIR